MTYQFTIRIGDVRIGIISRFERIWEQCKDFLTSEKPQIIIRSSFTDGTKKTEKSHQKYRSKGVVISPEEEESLEILRKIADRMIDEDYLLMHGAVVAKDGEAYIFTAPSGTGKTTRVQFWMDLYPDSIIVNGDKPMIHVTEEKIFVCGTPWAGKEGWGRNIQVPIRAIYLLERAEQDSVKKIQPREAVMGLLRQTHRFDEMEKDRQKVHMVAKMAGKVHFFRYRSTMTAESVRMAYEAAQAVEPIG